MMSRRWLPSRQQTLQPSACLPMRACMRFREMKFRSLQKRAGEQAITQRLCAERGCRCSRNSRILRSLDMRQTASVPCY